MDRFGKFVENTRLRVRKFINRNWHNDPEGDVFRCLDILYILGAIRYKPIQKWQRICWNTYRVVSVCSLSIFVLNLVDVIPEKFDAAKVTWHVSAVLTAILCFAKDFVLNQNFKSIGAVRDFINSKPFGSGDGFLDSACRKKCFQRLQIMLLVFHCSWLMDALILLLSSSRIDELFGTPRLVSRFGPVLSGGIHFLFIITMCPLWPNKYIAGTGTVCSLLDGLKTEREIFVRGFGNILEQVYSDVEEKLPEDSKIAPEPKRFLRDELYWKYLTQRVTKQVQLHIELVEKMQLLRPVVKYLFAIIYYNAMVLFSPFIYVALFNGLSLASLFLLPIVSFDLLECYVWCYMIETHQDINDTLEVKIMNLTAEIPYSLFHHGKYVDIQTTLRIMKTFVRNDQQFSCGGVFPITVEAFTDLLNIGYTVLTFLRDVGNKG